ncbi:TetR/AcrR family transcriptional regulator [Dyella silvatica]|uniref:TetR/AcrR family transcriptional regulator n=1 Tax=Dyella silvatica TaxID=2992128 RepID=UPI00225668C2|nr:TetR/AcrR family transcriptional regulator [Dyella silvatica]
MTREKNFDVVVARREMTQLFRRSGYRSTSMKDLEAVTGLLSGSLYNAFGGKQEVFLSSLDFYLANVVKRRIDEHLQGDDPIACIRALFTTTYHAELGKDRGCLLTNTAIEIGMHDKPTHAKVIAGICMFEREFLELVQRGQAVGKISPDKDPHKLARQLCVSYQGMLVMVKVVATKKVLDEYTDSIVESLI